MKGLLKGAVLAATITTAQAQEVTTSELPLAPGARVGLFSTDIMAGTPSASFFLEYHLQIQPMRMPGGDGTSSYEYHFIGVPCEDLMHDFEKSVRTVDEALEPTLIRIDHAAIRPSIEEAVKKAAEQCSPAIM